MDTITTFYRVEPSKIGFLRFIFEGYDNSAVVSTINPKGGIVSLTTPQGTGDLAERIMLELKKEVRIERINEESIR